MAFVYHRTIRFQDTDAAGVVYFANVLSFCHEAYEASLAAAGIELKTFFRGDPVAIPIVHAAIDYFQPMFCGETYAIAVEPALLSPGKFQIHYTIHKDHKEDNQPISRATTVHVCIDVATRSRAPLPSPVEQWLATIPSNPDISVGAVTHQPTHPG